MLLDEEDDELLPFRDRAEAGRILGAKLRGYIGLPNLLLLRCRAGVCQLALRLQRL